MLWKTIPLFHFLFTPGIVYLTDAASVFHTFHIPYYDND